MLYLHHLDARIYSLSGALALGTAFSGWRISELQRTTPTDSNASCIALKIRRGIPLAMRYLAKGERHRLACLSRTFLDDRRLLRSKYRQGYRYDVDDNIGVTQKQRPKQCGRCGHSGIGWDTEQRRIG